MDLKIFGIIVLKKSEVAKMEYTDTVKLLRECDAGTKMGVASIDETLEKVKDEKLKGLLKESKSHHEKLGNEIHALLIENNCEEKEPNPMAKGMSWMKTNIKLGMDNSDSAIAELITDGCDMGIKSLYKYLHQFKGADESSREACNRLISIEESLRRELTKYL